ncbi:hypothetical protein F4604DRAFT_1082875 [Suillus subluteus]|nr:hypothetical protein F4604DRAFT_1082875 [Suillus subluteus]
MNQEQALQAGIQGLRLQSYVHPLAALPHDDIGFQNDIISIFFEMFVVISFVSATGITIASTFDLPMKWKMLCASMIAAVLLYGISRHNDACYNRVVRKYSIAEWYWRSSRELRNEHPSLYSDLVSAQRFLNLWKARQPRSFFLVHASPDAPYKAYASTGHLPP